MRHIGAYKARTHLSRLLDAVGAGESITITRHGTPVAILIPGRRRRAAAAAAEQSLLDFRRAHRLRGIRIRDLIDERRSGSGGHRGPESTR